MKANIKNPAIPVVATFLLLINTLLAHGQNKNHTFDVTLGEWFVRMPGQITEGVAAFEVVNRGSMAHNFAIQGNKVDARFDRDLEPGETRTMEVELSAGTYSVFCPVGMHQEHGMTTTLTVIKSTPKEKMR